MNTLILIGGLLVFFSLIGLFKITRKLLSWEEAVEIFSLTLLPILLIVGTFIMLEGVLQ